MIHAVCGASAPALSAHSAPEDEEEEESHAGELETVEVTLGTLDLREFEVVPKRNRKRRKKRDKKVEKGEGEELAGRSVGRHWGSDYHGWGAGWPWPLSSARSPCAGPRAEETGCPDTQCRQPSLELVTELQGEAGAEPLPWGDGGKWRWELGLVDACPICWWLCNGVKSTLSHRCPEQLHVGWLQCSHMPSEEPCVWSHSSEPGSTWLNWACWEGVGAGLILGEGSAAANSA